ncbi:MAG: tRNA preQ1(34) S-adenosylmethionine ribosyltransferase-isomerase QueA [Granulosicoccus sp.]
MSHISDYSYSLPEELIAQEPLNRRSDSRLLAMRGRELHHRQVKDLPQLLQPGDHLVFNNTRVIPARLFGEKQTGGKLELMLERFTESGNILAKIRCSRSPVQGALISLWGTNGERIFVRVNGRFDDLFELSDLDGNHQRLASFITEHGKTPLPPYINREPNKDDKERYQTVFADVPGAVAAPTAGLHFDQALLEALAESGITHSFITLHVGAGTFQPVRVEDLSRHVMHAERVEVPESVVESVLSVKAQGGRVIAVGTTCVRSLEAAAEPTGTLQPFSGETQLFLKPGSRFNVVDGVLTNFHLPQSTLLMLVAAFAGLENTLAAYRVAVEQRYRFFSYGDAMLVWPSGS